MPIADPSDHLQDSYYLNTSLASPPDCGVFMPELTQASFLSNVFDAIVVYGCLSHGVATPAVSDPFESNLSTTYPAF